MYTHFRMSGGVQNFSGYFVTFWNSWSKCKLISFLNNQYKTKAIKTFFVAFLFQALFEVEVVFAVWEQLHLCRDPTRDGWIKEFINRKWSSGLFWAVGLQKKKTPNCHKDATFWGGFFYFFVGKKLKIILAATQKSINAKKILQNLYFWVWKWATDLFWNKSVIHRGFIF